MASGARELTRTKQVEALVVNDRVNRARIDELENRLIQFAKVCATLEERINELDQRTKPYVPPNLTMVAER